MTKAAEIALLDKVIGMFGRDSYLGPWLADNQLTIVRDITNDVSMSALMPNAALLKAREIITLAKKDAAEIVMKAKEQAAQIRQKADEDSRGVRRHTKWMLEEAARKL